MQQIWILAIVLILPGCGQQDGVTQCEAALSTKLKAPSTYHRADVRVTDINAANPSDISHFTQRWIDLTYDAANAYNAPIRGTHHCRFQLNDGSVGALVSDEDF